MLAGCRVRYTWNLSGSFFKLQDGVGKELSRKIRSNAWVYIGCVVNSSQGRKLKTWISGERNGKLRGEFRYSISLRAEGKEIPLSCVVVYRLENVWSWKYTWRTVKKWHFFLGSFLMVSCIIWVCLHYFIRFSASKLGGTYCIWEMLVSSFPREVHCTLQNLKGWRGNLHLAWLFWPWLVHQQTQYVTWPPIKQTVGWFATYFEIHAVCNTSC